ncbi:MAG: DNA polymerase I [Rhodocyclaceae bacterium]|uniref:DNA polymerase I n=1 Tax=Candidatus Desulfobacillus denitrificans TaxID=2608985 RepID=A0A809S891_9PROT|nr:DNA polymerase I [Candidatus Desulfobacillus denitrificans]GIK45376.1 MAG: DNA polymerase I [Betaproteobacteria bacterium]GJQ54264.1 MAG: DNA polymerase I [Rhodocyclaceae bacterium]
MPVLLLVDGSSYLYRAFHAMPDLRNRAGEPTGAVYGVIAMLRRLDSDFKANGVAYRACVFDAKGKTFRDEWYPDYKAHRPPMPDDLVRQIEPLHACIRALGWPLLAIEGVEADDVIGTLAREASRQGIEVVVSTGDKDLAQLVNPQVRLVNTMSSEVLDEAGVRAKFGVGPERIVDYFALVGDSVDNVPGVDKVGPKTAAKWLQEYGSLDAIVARAGEIGGKVGENLRKHLDFLPLGRKLVTVVCDLELPVKVADLAPQPPDKAKLAELFARLEFKTWLRELDTPSPPPGERAGARGEIAETQPAGAHRIAYETILDWPTFDAWLAKLDAAPLAAFDTETTSLDPMRAKLVGLSFAVADGEAAYLPLAHRYAAVPQQLTFEEALAKLKPWLESPRHAKVGQNLKYDMHVLANHGLRFDGIAHDTLLESYVVESDRSHDMDSMALRHLGIATIKYDEVTGKGASRIGFEQVDIARAAEYAAEDADVTLRLHEALHPRLAEEPRLEALYRDIEMPVMRILFRMERNGVLVDAPLLERQGQQLGLRMLEIEAQAHAAAKQPFNLNSPKQIQEILFEREQLPVLKKTPSGAPSTDEEVLEQLSLDYPLPKLILDYRGLAKLKSTYADKLPKSVDPATGRVHTNFSQAVAVTGRLASSDPNLQNIPIRTEEGRRIRQAFVAPAGSKLVSADYSQIELRIMAHLSGDRGLLEAFAAGEDIHRATAAEVFGAAPAEVTSEQRRYAKVINFGLIYGMSAFGLARQLGLERGAAQAYIDRYFARYPGVANYMETTRLQARERGYVETVFGRRLWLPEIKSAAPARRQAAERAAINAPMQGTAADIIKLAMIVVQRWLDEARMRTLLILQVHDELVLEVPEAELEAVRHELPKLMAGVAQLSVPLLAEVGVGANWDEAH